ISKHDGGLVYIPRNEFGIRPIPCYWDATWNSETNLYENIVPVPDGTGKYNMFATEIELSKFINNLTCIGDGFMRLQSADISELGSGMRIKCIFQTYLPDHEWKFSGVLACHKED
ncbi:MAG: hypothetical protein ACTSPQ_15120, partial [Candidatus Helarchaeota archaeon]